MTSQEKRLANAARECGEAIKAGLEPVMALAKTALAYGVPWLEVDRFIRDNQTNGAKP